MKKYSRIFLAVVVLAVCLGTMRPAQAIEGGYKEGLFVQSDDGDYLLKTRLFLQLQHQFLSLEGQGKTNGFQVRRTRLLFLGNAFHPDFTYQFEFEMASGLTNNVSESVAETGPNLRDSWINYDTGRGIEIKAGQFKVPFNLGELIPDSKQQFIDRSETDDAFSYSRDIGLDLHGRVIDKKLEYHAYVFNDGLNQNKFIKNNEMLFGARIVYSFLGDHGYTASDVENSASPQFMAGIAGTYNRVGAPAVADQSVIAATGDVAFRYRGFSTISAAYYLRNQTAGTNSFGLEGQAGYFILPNRLEAIVRCSGVIPTAAGFANGYEGGGGLNYYFYGHRLKLLTDYALLINSPLVLGVSNAVPAIAPVTGPAAIVVTGGAPGFVQNQNDHRVRTQLQVVF